MLYINDGTEFSLAGSRSGIVVRYRGKIRGVMLLVRGHELSWFSFKRVQSISWNNVVRIPGMRRKIW